MLMNNTISTSGKDTLLTSRDGQKVPQRSWMRSIAIGSLAMAAVLIAGVLHTGKSPLIARHGVEFADVKADLSKLNPRMEPRRVGPEVLVWHGHDKKLNATVGSLRVQLDPFDDDSPHLHLRVAIRRAAKQPSPHGALFLHCGGPGSGVDCITNNSVEGFDSFSIDQRGIGELAQPRLQCSGSHLPPEGKESYELSDFSSCPCAVPDGSPSIGETWVDIDPENETLVHDLFNHMWQWGRQCYFADKFQLRGKKNKTYNFLDYVGTQYLAYDVDRLRQAMGVNKINIHGWSYGTLVGAVYATVFANFTGKVVLDGNMPSTPHKPILAEGGAHAMQKAVGRMLINCEIGHGCPMKEPQKDYNDIMDACKLGKITAPTKKGQPFALTVGMLHGYMQTRFSDNTGVGWGKVEHTLSQLSPRNPNASSRTEAVKFILDGFCSVKGVPTWYNYNICAGPGTTMEDENATLGSPYIEQTTVLSVDLAGFGLIDDAIRFWRAMKGTFRSGLTSLTAATAGNFFWPNTVTPPAPIGSSVAVIVVGNLFDPNTDYGWSQEMKKAFPNGRMITWQGVGHTLPTNASYNAKEVKRCNDIIKVYFFTGEMPLDGFVCRQTDAVPVTAKSY